MSHSLNRYYKSTWKKTPELLNEGRLNVEGRQLAMILDQPGGLIISQVFRLAVQIVRVDSFLYFIGVDPR